MIVGERIKMFRAEKKLTLRDLSKKADISISFLSDIENGRSNPSLERLKDIAAALNVPIIVLLDENINNKELSPEQKIKNAVSDDPELSEFWRKLSQREDLRLLMRQVLDMPPKEVKRIIRLIKAVEDEEAAEEYNPP
jgi:transcriptional regulator with XRE-family HTH domain